MNVPGAAMAELGPARRSGGEGASPARLWLAAALLVVAVAGGLFAVRLLSGTGSAQPTTSPSAPSADRSPSPPAGASPTPSASASPSPSRRTGTVHMKVPLRIRLGSPARPSHCRLTGSMTGDLVVTVSPAAKPNGTSLVTIDVSLSGTPGDGPSLHVQADLDCGKVMLRTGPIPNVASGRLPLDLPRSMSLVADGKTLRTVRGYTYPCELVIVGLQCTDFRAGLWQRAASFTVPGTPRSLAVVIDPVFHVSGKATNGGADEVPLTRWRSQSRPVTVPVTVK